MANWCALTSGTSSPPSGGCAIYVVVDALRTDLAAPAYTDELRLFVECYDVRTGAQLQFDVVN